MAVAGDPQGYYRALGIERTASADAIKAAFRHRAKSLHPDQSGNAHENEAFRLLLEAYEALRDPQLRLRYDAASLAAERGTFERDRADPYASDGSAADPAPPSQVSSGNVGLHRAVAFATAHATPLLMFALAAAAGLAMLGWTQAAERSRTIAELTTELEEARARSVEAAGRSELPQLYRTVFRFPAGMAELDAAARSRLAAVTGDLRGVIAALPEGSEWLIGVEGVIARAADGGGLMVAASELALLRVGVTAQYLVGQGIPAERVSMRFHAGALAPGQGRRQAQGVALSLFCCLPGPVGG